MKFIDLIINEDLSIEGMVELKWSPTGYVHLGEIKTNWKYVPSDLVIAIKGKIDENGLFTFSYDPSKKIKFTQSLHGYGTIINKELSIPEIFKNPPPGIMEPTMETIILRKFKFIENEKWVTLSYNGITGPLKFKFILHKEFCTKRDKIPLNMFLSTEYQDETKILPNGTKITKTNDKIKIVSEDGCVEIFITEYSKIIGSDGTEIEIVTRKILDGVISSHLYKGYIQVDIWEGGKHHYFFTKNAIVKTNGTNFDLNVKDDGSTVLTVLDGEVEFSDINKKKTVIVKKNQKSICKTGAFPSKPASIKTNKIQKWWGEEGDTIVKKQRTFTEKNFAEIMEKIMGITSNTPPYGTKAPAKEVTKRKMSDEIYVEIVAYWIYLSNKYQDDPMGSIKMGEEIEKICKKFDVTYEDYATYQEKLTDENPEHFSKLLEKAEKKVEELKKANK